MNKSSVRMYFSLLGGKFVGKFKAVFTRPSPAFDLSANTLLENEPIIDKIKYTPEAFNVRTNLANPWASNVAVPTYAEIVAQAKAIAAAHPTKVIYENLCAIPGGVALASGREMAALRFFDTSSNPIYYIQTGIHGAERDAVLAIFHVMQLILTGDDPLHVWVRENMSIHWLLLGNPDGVATEIRRNSQNVNLNRNWDWFWEATPDTDKGPAVFSEIESRNFRNWMTFERLARGKLFVDWHMWSSATDYGFLTEHIHWNGEQARHLHRSVYGYAQKLVQSRDYSGYALVGGLANMRLNDRKSARKAYPTYWAQMRMPAGAFGLVMELPEAESQHTNAAVTMDIMEGSLQALRDVIAYPARDSIYLAPSVLQSDILNTNSLLTDWNIANKRPNFTRLSGLDAQQGEGYVQTTRPGNVALPSSMGYMGHLTHVTGDPTTSFVMLLAGKRITQAASNVVTIEFMAGAPVPVGTPPVANSPINIKPLPLALQEIAIASDGTFIYAVCGHTGTVYNANIYRIPIATIKTASWTLWHTVSTDFAVQRHTAHVWNGKLLIVGGRNATNYLTTVNAVDLSTKAETLQTSFTNRRGWHGSAIIGDELYLVGGWSGSAALTDVRKVNLATGVQTVLAPLPSSRRQGVLVVRDNPDGSGTRLWLLSGQSATGSLSSTVYYYDVTANTWTGLLEGSGYTNVIDTVDEEDPTPPPSLLRISAGVSYDPFQDTINVFGGEDTLGDMTSTVFIFDPDQREMGTRNSGDFTWGYLRPSQSWTLAPGDQVTLTVAARNPQPSPDVESAYIRPTLFVGPLSNYQAFRHAYMVVQQGDFQTLSTMTEIYAGGYASGEQVRAYMRHYTGNTQLHLKGVQVVKKGYVGVLVPELGKSEDQLVITFKDAIKGQQPVPNENFIRGAFVPRWGNQMTGSVLVMDFAVAGGLDYARLKWVGAYVGSFPSFAPGNVAVGKFVLEFATNGGTNEIIDIAPDGWEINHDRFAPWVRHDTVHYEIASVVAGIRIRLLLYGKVRQHIIHSGGSIKGFASRGSGVSMYIEGIPNEVVDFTLLTELGAAVLDEDGVSISVQSETLLRDQSGNVIMTELPNSLPIEIN